MNKIPTAKEFKQRLDKANHSYTDEYLMIEFAKLHVQKALEVVSKKAKATIEIEYDDQPSSSFPPFEYAVINEKSILNAYPLTNIK